MNTTITRKLPVDSVSDVADAIAETVVESIHRVGELVPDRVPDVVSDAVHEGVTRGRRVGRQVIDHLPGERRSSNAKRWALVLTVVGVVGVVLVMWRMRSGREADDYARDDWSMSETTPRTTSRSPGRVVA